MKINIIIWGIVTTVVLSTIVISLGSPSSDAENDLSHQSVTTPTPVVQDTRDLSKYGRVEYDAPQLDDPREWERRRQINQKYDNQGWVAKSVHPVTAGVGKIADDAPPQLFPIDESVLIVVGDIIRANAYLSNDKGGVYTEFTIRVDEVLQNTTEEAKPTKVIADREGGVVIYPNGQRVKYESSNRELPELGSRYLFFLTKNDQSLNYEILTSYNLSSVRIRQMEIGRPFDEFKDANKTILIEIVRNRIVSLRSQ